jgi:hypothetical protein
VRVPRRGGYVRRQLRYLMSAARLWPGHDVAYVHSLGLALPRRARPRVGRIVSDQAWERAVNRGWVPPDPGADARPRRRLLTRLNRMLHRGEARRLDAVIVPSEYVRRTVVGWGIDPARVTVVYNALAADLAVPAETKRQARFRPPGEAERCAAGSDVGLERFSWDALVEQTARVLTAIRGRA